MASIDIPIPSFSITVEPPDTKENFKLFNKECEELDSEFLMQPVNEADYDSETQICVDTNTGGPRSFYDHFTTKRKKKKLRRGVDGPTKETPKVRVDITKVPMPEGAQNEENAPRHQDPSMLTTPGNAIPKGALSNVQVRRLACGRMPPPPTPSTSSPQVLLSVPNSTNNNMGASPKKGFTKTAMPPAPQSAATKEKETPAESNEKETPTVAVVAASKSELPSKKEEKASETHVDVCVEGPPTPQGTRSSPTLRFSRKSPNTSRPTTPSPPTIAEADKDKTVVEKKERETDGADK